MNIENPYQTPASELLGEAGMPAEEQRKFLRNISVETERLQKNIDLLLALRPRRRRITPAQRASVTPLSLSDTT